MNTAPLLAQWHTLHNELSAKFPMEIIEAVQLQLQVKDGVHANAETAWRNVWTKPLYAHNSVENATRQIALIAPRVQALIQGTNASEWTLTRIAKKAANASFKVEGSDAIWCRDRARIAAYRLYAIQGALHAFQQRMLNDPVTPFADIDQRSSLLDAVLDLQDEFGEYWGPITVLHVLTDFGIACKPDLHLVRTIRHLGYSTGRHPEAVPDLAQCIRINDHVRHLCGVVYPGEPIHMRLRYVDKVLMSFSKCGLLPTL